MAGIPRGRPDLSGRVEFYDSRNLRRYYQLYGYQHGAGFGHSLLSADLNNDGFDDVIIGAPLHSALEIRDGWEVGRIFVYYSDGNGDFLVEQTITGQYPGGRFGFALAAIGDINQDGNQDVAVSSPYFGDGKEGRVSIHLGLGERGLSPTATQHISPSQFGMDLTSFGFALASGMDIDNNSYPDLVIGSYQSDAAVVLRSRPVVSFGVHMSLNGSAGIDLENRDLVLNDGSAVSSFNIYLCLHYSAPAVPEILDFSCTLTCDFRRQHPRAVFLIPDGEDSAILRETVTLTRDVRSCISYTAYVLNSIRQKLQPIKVKFDYDIASDPSDGGNGSILPPILNAGTRYYRKLSVPILRDCNGTVCVPDLSISATPVSQAPLIVGAEGAVVIRTIISNNGEDAYESVLNLTEPRDFFFTRAVQRTDNEEHVTCTKDHASKSGKFSCLLGNPMKAGEMIVLELQFATDSVSGDRSNISFQIDVSSAHTDLPDTQADNIATVEVETATSRALALSSDATLNVVGSAYRLHLQENITATAKATTRIAPRWMVVTTGEDNDNTAEMGVELGWAGIFWAVVGACLAGVTVLIVTNLILYKVGFFKRQQIGKEESIQEGSVVLND
ncbi:integrin alpha-PS2-like [Diadema setosum]|uniref:integrin alpha-PS2-like n=1 Tax=Diadema setosum TaxID=31175 RepID=UPI003B3A5E7A